MIDELSDVGVELCRVRLFSGVRYPSGDDILLWRRWCLDGRFKGSSGGDTFLSVSLNSVRRLLYTFFRLRICFLGSP